jgi:hypothetical protein
MESNLTTGKCIVFFTYSWGAYLVVLQNKYSPFAKNRKAIV